MFVQNLFQVAASRRVFDGLSLQINFCNATVQNNKIDTAYRSVTGGSWTTEERYKQKGLARRGINLALVYSCYVIRKELYK